MIDFHGLTLFDIYEKNSVNRGRLPAINWNGKKFTYADLFNRTTRLARGLKDLNMVPGSRIAILSQNHPAFFDLFGAASALNLTLVLINKRLSPDEVKYIIEDTTPALIIADKNQAEQAKELKNDFACMQNYFIIESDDDNCGLENLYHSQGIERTAFNKSSDPYIIIHTAAVQGKPRGAVLGQENVILSSQQIIHAFNLDESQTYLNILPLFHIMGLSFALGILQAGGKNVILDQFDAEKSVEVIQNQNVNILGSFPPILTGLIDAARKNNFDLSSLRIVAGLDRPEVIDEWEDLTNSKFWTMYGQTETSGVVTLSESFAKPGSAGEASRLANIKIIDKQDNILPPNEIGEIVVRGPLVFQGYWKSDDLNKRTFRKGWHHTGDLGMFDSDGFLFFKGRKAEKELIKSGGENVFPAEVENIIMEHGAVKEVCVFGVPDPKFGEGIKAVCVLNENQTLIKQDLIEFVGTKIAGYKKPRYVEFVVALAKAENGSIDREKVKNG